MVRAKWLHKLTDFIICFLFVKIKLMVKEYKDMYEDAMDEVKTLRVQLKKQKESIEDMGSSLMSSVEEKGKYTTQILHFVDGNKKTFQGVETASIQQSEFTRMDLKDGRRIYVNQRNINCFEVFSE